ncbi:MAG: carbonic anhydrase [Tepidiformaceae bacterium]
MTAIDDALKANLAFAAQFTEVATPPRPRLALVLCMDARIDPIRALGLPTGHAHIIRNAGGRVVDAIRSLIVSQTVIGTEEVAIVHHTQCGMETFTDAEIRQKLRDERNAIADDIAFLAFRDQEQAIRDDIRIYRQSALLRQDIPVRGFIYDVATGRLREVS